MPRRITLVKALILCGAAILPGCRSARSPEIDQIMRADRFAPITSRAAEFRVQVLLAEVVRGDDGRPALARSAYRADAEYFYPASTIKLCGAVAAVQKLESLAAAAGRDDGQPGLDTPIAFLPSGPGEVVVDSDPTNLDGGTITAGHEIRKLFLVSDNQAFNRLYDLVGHRELNERMHALGLSSVVINHRLSSPRLLDGRVTPAAELRLGDRTITLPAQTSDLSLRNTHAEGLLVGRGYMAGDQLRPEPMDFSARNGVSLHDLQDLLVLVVRPDIDMGRPPLVLAEAHRQFLCRAMAEFPGDSVNPRYDRAEFPNDWGKFFLPGLRRVVPEDELVIRNKVGQAYGFTLDNAYIENTRLGRAFFLTAVIYTNADGVLNDDRYEYDAVALPFMADLAEAVARAMWPHEQPLPAPSLTRP